ncbi:hypothetical protein HNY73_015919 [Argiope bruennichi]|uniref:Gustatory receptor n=1 Tax=Argiope bruennichi TaxID=94029 RepID=A0A8T0EIE4_ARGBR|nr:hypothetical protein HNY73_015919 [Argiope bruennichi]
MISVKDIQRRWSGRSGDPEVSCWLPSQRVISWTPMHRSVSALTMPSTCPLRFFYNFYGVFQDGTSGILTRFFIIHLAYSYQFVYPCLVAMMCGILIFEFSEFLTGYQKRLDYLYATAQRCPSALLEANNRDKMRDDIRMHTRLFKTMRQLQDAISHICFAFICNQAITLFCFLSDFMLTEEKDFSIPKICENIFIIVSAPCSLFGISFCASGIRERHEKLQATLSLLIDTLLEDHKSFAGVILSLNNMKKKAFPVLSAGGIADLSPKFMISLIGTIFTYGLLILNLKK